MKFNKIIIFTFILLTLFSISQVSAAENITADNSTLPAEDSDLVQDDIMDDTSSADVNDGEIAKKIKVEFDEQMWQENLTDIRVDFPANATGEFCLKIDNEIIYNQTVTNSSIAIPVKIPKNLFYIQANVYPPYDYTSHRVTAFYNNIEINISHMLKVMKYSPDSVFLRPVPEEILQYQDGHEFFMLIPRSASGGIEVYIDGKKISATNKAPYVYLNNFKITHLSLGNHKIVLKYLGDSYYRPSNATFNFTVTNVLISIPNTVNIGHDDCVSVEVLKNTSGTVKIYVDNALVYTGKTENGQFIISLEKYLKWNSSKVKVVFTGKHYSRTKTVPINVFYDFDIWGESFTYGEDNKVEILLPDTLNNKLLHVEINGAKYSFARPSHIMNNIVEVDVSKLLAGNYTMFVSYSGDSRFIAKNKTFNFTISYNINVPYDVVYLDGSVISLTLPSNAKGNLCVYMNGKLYKSVKLEKGKAKISFDKLNPGIYKIRASYTGNDYIVEDVNSSFDVSPCVRIDDYYVIKGVDSYLYAYAPSTCKGYVVFCINGKDYKVNIKNGVAKLNLKNFAVDEYDVDIDYYGADGFNTSLMGTYFEVMMPKLKIVSLKAYATGVYAKIKASGYESKPLGKLTLTVKFNGKTYKVKTNTKGIAIFKKSIKLKIKKYKLTVQYKKLKKSKTVKTRHVVFLKTVKVKKSAKKLVLKATLKKGKTPIKGKIVTFKFNGKKYKAKTTKKGVAKVTIKKSILKKLKVGKKVKYQATFLKDTVKKTVKVRK